MRNWTYCLTGLLALAAMAFCGSGLRADVYTTTAFDNGTIWPSGPRPAPNGKNYFNIEGANNGQYACFAAADFISTHFRDANHQHIGPISQINSLNLVLTQDNAAFTNNGQLNFYLTQQVITSIDPDPTDPTYFETAFDPNDVNGEGLNGQLTPLTLIGTGTFTQQGQTGQVDTFPLTLDAASQTYLVSQINSLGSFRIVITPADPDVSATYAGFSDQNTDQNGNPVAGPVIMIDAN